jgi:hypothetical protein
MRKTKSEKTNALTRMRLALAGFAGAGSLTTAGLLSFNATAHSASYSEGLTASGNTIAIVLVGALFCVTAALSWAFLNHLADSSSPRNNKPKQH